MDHPTVDELIDFVSVTELNEKTVALCAAANAHIRRCEKCLRLTRALQTLYDEFSRLCLEEDFRHYLEEKTGHLELENFR